MVGGIKMATASQILEWIKDWIDKYEFNYKINQNELQISDLKVDCKLKNCDISYMCYDDHIAVSATIKLRADKDCQIKVAEYITRANDCDPFGSFQMDFDDGEICYRYNIDCTDRTSLPNQLLNTSLNAPLSKIEEYGDGLIAVMYGIKSPEEAIKDIEKNNK